MTARVGIVLGSDSDLPHVQAALDILDELGVAREVRIMSAHRTPDETAEYARTAQGRGLSCIIAAAGGAAALPGAVSAYTTLPVIGLPVTSVLNGLDSLLSMTQMPPGVPVAAVGVGGARNAGLFAARIVASGANGATAEEAAAASAALVAFTAKQAERVRDKDRRVNG